MDDSTSAGGKNSPSLRSREASTDISQAADLDLTDDHADSPLRKRPRLEAKSDESSDMPAQTDGPNSPPSSGTRPTNPSHTSSSLERSGSPASSHPPPHTPSKVTLNLRNVNTLPSDSSANDAVYDPMSGVSSAEADVPVSPTPVTGEQGQSPSPIPKNISIGSPASSTGDSVVEIEIENPEDMEEADQHAYPQDMTLVMRFPLAEQYGTAVAVKHIAHNINNGDLESPTLWELSAWLDSWVQHVGANAVHRPIYQVNEFWNSLGLVYARFLTRRTELGTVSVRPDDGKKAQRLHEFLAPYIRLCGNLMAVDVANFEENMANSSVPSDIVSQIHVKNLERIFNPRAENSHWAVLERSYRIDTTEVLQNLALSSLAEPHDTLFKLVRLTRLYVGNAFVWSSHNLAASGFRAILHASSCLKMNDGGDGHENERISRFCHEAFELIQATDDMLQRNVGQQNAALPVDFSIDMINLVGHLMQSITEVDADLGKQQISQFFPAIRDATSHDDSGTVSQRDYPVLLRHAVLHKIYWHYIARGRMELRAQSMHQLTRVLVSLWSNYKDTSTSHPVLQAAADLLIQDKAVEYLVSVDSHLQLVKRSNDVVGFILVTQRWSQEMTDAIWTTISTSQDPRIVTATLDMLGGIIHLAHAAELDNFCYKLSETPVSAFSPTMTGLLWRLIDASSKVARAEEESALAPHQLCICLVRKTFANDFGPETDTIFNARCNIFDMLQTISKKNSTPELRRTLYEDCLKDVQQRTRTSTGSIEAVRALLMKHSAEDMALVVHELDFWATFGEDLCDFVQSNGNRGLPLYAACLVTRLNLFKFLMVCGPAPPISEYLQRKIWDHLVGENAPDVLSRDHSWNCFVEIVKNCNQQHDFVERSLAQFLPTLPPYTFTNGLLSFVQASIAYIQRTNPPPIPNDDSPLEVPLSDYLWNIILTAPEHTIEKSAVVLLSRQYLDTNIFEVAGKECAAESHKHLIERCVSQLKAAAKKVNSFVDGTMSGEDEPMIIVPTEHERQTEEMRFSRTLQFLRQFLTELKTQTFFRLQESSKPPPANSPISADKGEVVSLKYQAFGPGLNHETREIPIGRLATFSELSAKLCRLTGFTDVRVFQGGQKLDLKHDPSQMVDSIASRGCLLVQGSPAVVAPAKMTSANLGNTAAARAVLEHFDDLYDFLDLEESLASLVLDFLAAFPPHDRVREIVISDDPRISELFPNGKRSKTLYSLRSLRMHLASQKSSTFDEKFILHGVKILTSTLIDPAYTLSQQDGTENIEILAVLVDCLNEFLSERPLSAAPSEYMANEEEIAKRLHAIIENTKDSHSTQLAYVSERAYTAMIEASFHSRLVWETFTSLHNMQSIHHWLLISQSTGRFRQAIGECISYVCTSVPPSSHVTKKEFCKFYWLVISEMIPGLTTDQKVSKDIFTVASSVFLSFDDLHQDEQTLQSMFDLWSRLLAEHHLLEIQGHSEIDEFVLGMAHLLSHCLTSLRSSKKPISTGDLADVIFNNYLFPPLSDCSNNSSLDGDPSMPVVDSETRSVLYGLLFSLCQDESSYKKLILSMKGLEELEAESNSYPWGTDYERWLRPSPGYGGLRNLANTCYMNSLLTQLFMNFDFRQYMLDANVADGHGSQKLLAETQALFAQMQNSSERFADTDYFTQAIKPYDGDSIDTTIQMDVDEFYNLLFDRWEAQLLTPTAKQNFRSFYGGQLVTQIKSKDCNHVSETLEPFMAIQCDVKGKPSLLESLKAYVEGDVMEGENKYKCESCGGRLVNAVKRSCLKDLPNNLIFHLKRFDFDLNTLQRHKINDRFEFPNSIDMTPFMVNYLNNPENELEKDLFELVGVLVHNGTAETGHYYSYIKLPATTGKPHSTWLEFNDSDVSEFDYTKIPDQCFGGAFDSSGIEYQWTKPYNAYMLFYRRVSILKADAEANSSHNGIGPILSSVPIQYEEAINRQNEILIRRLCLYNHTHAHFVRNVLGALKNITKGNCSSLHEIEEPLIYMVLGYLDRVACRLKDVPNFEGIILDLRKTVLNCAQCCHLVFIWMDSRDLSMRDMLLGCPHPKVRGGTADLVYALLKEQRNRRALEYGLDPSDDDLEHILDADPRKDLPSMVGLLHHLFTHLGEMPRLWNEYFGLWYSIATLGAPETAFAIKQGIFNDSLEVLLVDREGTFRRSGHLEETLHRIQKAKRTPPLDGLVKLVWHFLKHINPWSPHLLDRDSSKVDISSTEPLQFYPTKREKILLQHFDDQKRRIPFLAKILDSGENLSDQIWYPGEIINLLLDYEPPAAFVNKMEATFTETLNEFLPSAVLPYIKGGLYFCKMTNFDKPAKQIIKSVAGNAADVDTMEETKRDFQGLVTQCPASGGHNYLDFLREVAFMDGVKWASSPQDRPYLTSVIAAAPDWAPALLRYQDKVTRDNTASFLDSIIFSRFPSEEVDEIAEIDLSRNRIIPMLFAGSTETVQKKVELGMSHAYVSQTLNVMHACALWTEKVVQSESPVFFALREKCDETMMRRFQNIQMRLPGGAVDDEGDDALTETEWASNFDDDSDDLTDTAEQ